MAHLSLTLLGPAELHLEGSPVSGLRSTKTRALLYFLALEGERTHPRIQLASLLWPEVNDRVATRNLRQSIYLIGRALTGATGDLPHLLVTRESVRFNPDSDHELDVARFMEYLAEGALEQAAELYRGDLLEGFTVDSAPFEEWLLFKRESLHRRAMDLLQQLAAQALDRHDYPRARAHARRQLSQEPWREEAHRQLITALARDGQRTAALAQYESCRRILAEELGVEPGAETRALVARLRTGGDNFAVPVAKPDTPRHNLPTPLSPLIGRDEPRARAMRLLQIGECRLMTLTGIGGVGKTRLALDIAHALREEGTWDAIHFVSFADVAPMHTEEAFAAALVAELQERFPALGKSWQSPTATLERLWRAQRVLLVLDNCEHVVAGATWCLRALRAVPGLKILATSRERFRLRHEWVVPVEGLTVASDLSAPLSQSAAAQLFVRRARQVHHAFAVEERTLPDIHRICQLMEGMPLGVELAAARARHYSTREILSQVEQSLMRLSSDERDRPTRHRNLQVVVEDSWARLSPELQHCYLRLSLFHGSFNTEEARAAAAASEESLQRFVDRSLLAFDPSTRTFSRHPLLTEFAAARLAMLPEERLAAQTRHAQFYATFLQERQHQLESEPLGTVLPEIDRALENVHAAWHWAISTAHLPMLQTGLAPLAEYYTIRGYHAAGERFFLRTADQLRAALLAQASPDSALQTLLCDVLAALTYFVHARSKFVLLEELIQEIYQRATPRNDRARVIALRWEGRLLRREKQLEEAQERLEEGLALSEATGFADGQAQVLRSLAYLALDRQRYARARQYVEAAWALRERIPQRHEWLTLRLFGFVEMAEGRHLEALAVYRQALSSARRIGDAFAEALVHERMGDAHLKLGNGRRAHRYLLRALQHYHEVGAREYETRVRGTVDEVPSFDSSRHLVS